MILRAHLISKANLVNFGIFVMIKLIPFDKIIENSAAVVSLLTKQSIAVLTNWTPYFMFSGEFVNYVTLKIECLYAELSTYLLLSFQLAKVY